MTSTIHRAPNHDLDAGPPCTYLVDQGYGFAQLPEDWIPVQWNNDVPYEDGEWSSGDPDLDAVIAAARDHGGCAWGWFPGEYDEEADETTPGDYAICPNIHP